MNSSFTGWALHWPLSRLPWPRGWGIPTTPIRRLELSPATQSGCQQSDICRQSQCSRAPTAATVNQGNKYPRQGRGGTARQAKTRHHRRLEAEQLLRETKRRCSWYFTGNIVCRWEDEARNLPLSEKGQRTERASRQPFSSFSPGIPNNINGPGQGVYHP